MKDLPTTRPVAAALALIAAVVATYVVPIAGASEPTAGSDADDAKGAPNLLFLSLAREPDDEARERRFVTQISLALDAFRVTTLYAIDRFSEMTMSDRLAWLRPQIEERRAVAALWIESVGGDSVILYLVSLDTGRAFLRIIEAARSDTAEAELALAVQEMLGEAYLFNPEKRNEPLDIVVDELVEKAEDSREDVDGLEAEAISIGLRARFGSGVYGHRGPSWSAGGEADVELRWRSGFFARLSFFAGGEPLAASAVGDARGWTLGFGPTAGYLFGGVHWKFGPVVGVHAQYGEVTVEARVGDVETFGWWNARLSAGCELRARLTERFEVSAAPTLGALVRQRDFYRNDDGALLLSTPRLDWRVQIGAHWVF